MKRMQRKRERPRKNPSSKVSQRGCKEQLKKKKQYICRFDAIGEANPEMVVIRTAKDRSHENTIAQLASNTLANTTQSTM